MLINLSNHPSNKWEGKQKEEAGKLANDTEIVDIEFPLINPYASTNEIVRLAHLYLDEIYDYLDIYNKKTSYLHIMGEFTFVHNVIRIIELKNSYPKYEERVLIPIASCTERIVEEVNGGKEKRF